MSNLMGLNFNVISAHLFGIFVSWANTCKELSEYTFGSSHIFGSAPKMELQCVCTICLGSYEKKTYQTSDIV